MIRHDKLSNAEFGRLVRHKVICLGGNSRLRIYGTMKCKSGKRMKKENRVFFASEQEAHEHGYRPCAHCMIKEYKKYKNGPL
ncbi:metal-binding protein [Flavihumibacter sp. R14]|nr:metal-binding protein [Flavihumibacter soli]